MDLDEEIDRKAAEDRLYEEMLDAAERGVSVEIDQWMNLGAIRQKVKERLHRLAGIVGQCNALERSTSAPKSDE